MFNHVVFEEDYAARELRHAAYLHYTTYQVCSGFVLRVCFACKDKLNALIDDFLQPFEIGEKQIGSFVCGKAACKTHGEFVAREFLYGLEVNLRVFRP